MRAFAGVDVVHACVPDETTFRNFRRRIDEHKLPLTILEFINKHLMENGVRMNAGSTVDATFIEAPSSTKYQSGARDPEMHQIKKGKVWHFGMNALIGCDAELKMIHSDEETPKNTHDATVIGDLVRPTDNVAWADKVYVGTETRIQDVAPDASIACSAKASFTRL